MSRAVVTTVQSIEPLGENLTVIRVVGSDNQIVANKREDGSWRFAEGEPVVYVPEDLIVPEDVLKERGYWDEAKGKGLLGGNKGNRVKMRRMAEVESRGLLWKVGMPGQDWTDDAPEGKPYWVMRESLGAENDSLYVGIGDDVTEFFGLTEHTA